jgi:hypothetical protein
MIYEQANADGRRRLRSHVNESVVTISAMTGRLDELECVDDSVCVMRDKNKVIDQASQCRGEMRQEKKKSSI